MDDMIAEKISPIRLWIGRLFKLAFFILALGAVFVTVLANMGGNSDELKGSAERFIGDAFGGQTAYIGKLVRLSFFPKVGIDMERMQVTARKAEGDLREAQTLAVVSKFRMYLDFWDVLLGQAKFTVFQAENGYFKEGVLSAKPLTIERGYVDHDETTGTAKLVMQGLYAKDPWKFNFGLGVSGYSGAYKYEIGSNMPVSFELADVQVTGFLTKSSNNFMKIADLQIKRNDHVVKGDVYASLVGDGLIKFKGDMKFGAAQEAIGFDVVIDYKAAPLKISGTINGHDFALDKVFGEKSLRTLYEYIYVLIRGGELPKTDSLALSGALKAITLDLKADFKNIKFDNKNMDAQFSIKQTGSNIALTQVNGKYGESTFLLPKVAIIEQSAGVFYTLAMQMSDCYGGKIISGADAAYPTTLLPKGTAARVSLDTADYAYVNAVFETAEEKTCANSFFKAGGAGEAGESKTVAPEVKKP